MLCALGAVGTYVVGVLTEPGQRIDVEIFGWAQRLHVGLVGDALPSLARRVLPAVMAIVALGCGFRSLVQGRTRLVVQCLALVVGSTSLCWLLREHVLGRPYYGDQYSYLHNTFPSTHVALVVSLCAAVWLLARPTSRSLSLALALALALALVLVVVLALLGNVVGHAHRPSDVLGSLLVVAACALLVRRRDSPPSSGSGRLP
ncbi:phosphatase PAP2 family protein [Janibacter indicus]|uniref:Phosphatase PAP2 family protein n=1 Tax=Janibacter indicus TaxID=857417 RepID=A0A7L9IXK6_9MICO|nr:phosphatase PAP2 family protein [Janibacter indicus]QOK22028.1 phosphatase PAP2 family protein [Janibacter indicus]